MQTATLSSVGIVKNMFRKLGGLDLKMFSFNQDVCFSRDCAEKEIKIQILN